MKSAHGIKMILLFITLQVSDNIVAGTPARLIATLYVWYHLA